MAATPYKLFLDIQTCQSKLFGNRGIPRYVRGHARALVERGCVAALGLNPMQKYPENLDSELARSALLTWITAPEFRRKSTSLLAYHITSPFEDVPFQTLVPPFLGDTPIVVTLYDLIPLLNQSTYLPKPESVERYSERLRLIERADLVLTISTNTRADALRLLEVDPDRMVFIGSAVSDYFRPTAPGERPEEIIREELPAITRPFVLCVGGADPRKNVDRLIEAYAGLPESLRGHLQLAIACQLHPAWTTFWEDRSREFGLAPGEMVLTNFVADDVLRALYQTATLSVFPSLYEGFGLPAAEAAACGCLTITSNSSSLPEVLDLEEATFNPLSAESITKVMHRALTDASFQGVLRRAAKASATKHVWDAVAERTVAALSSLPAPSASSAFLDRSSHRLRLALAGPFPPIRSGIADYNWRLAGELAKLSHLDLLCTEGSDPAPEPGNPGVRVLELAQLGDTLNPGSYDAIIYTFGNSQHHLMTLDKALEYPGVMWFHDIRLSGFYLTYGWLIRGPEGVVPFMADKLKSFYGERLPPQLAGGPPMETDVYQEYGLGLTVELAQNARAALVNSEFAAHLLEVDQGPFAIPRRIGVIPLAVPAPPPGFAAERQELLIGTFGIGSMHKAPDLAIEALAILRELMPARLVFVGSYEADLRRTLEHIALENGVTDAIKFSGEVDEPTYWAWLGRVACAVQLRRQIHGESSAGVNDCLAAGTPVVTNLISCRELPQGVVDLLPAEFSPAELANRLQRQLSDATLREAHTSATRNWAEANGFDRVAARLVQFVSSLSPALSHR